MKTQKTKSRPTATTRAPVPVASPALTPTMVMAMAVAALLTVATGCHVRGRMGVHPVVVHAAPPRQAPPPPVAYYAAPPPAQPQYAPPPAGAPAPAACVDPGDRDLPDLFDHPTPVEANSTTVGCTHRGDADLFAIAVPPGAAGHLIRYTLRGQFEMAPSLQIFNANRRRIDSASIGKRQELVGWIYVAGGTQVLARIAQVHGVNEAYTFTLQTIPLADATEPNDSAEQATALVAGTALSGFMANPTNNDSALSDWYRIDVPQDGEIAIDVDMSQGIAAIARLYDSFSRKLIRQQTASRGERFSFKNQLRRGTYHLHLNSVHRVEEAGSGEPPPAITRPYTISIAR